MVSKRNIEEEFPDYHGEVYVGDFSKVKGHQLCFCLNKFSHLKFVKQGVRQHSVELYLLIKPLTELQKVN